MNLPNVLTLSRFVMIPLFFVAFFQGQPIVALGIVLLAGLTDLLDGYIARQSGQITAAGVMLDPLADKLMMLSVVIALVIDKKIPWEAAAAMAVREGGMIASSAIFHFRGKKTLPANAVGKLTTFLYYVAIVLLFFNISGGVPTLWCAIALSFVASFVYLAQFRAQNGKGAPTAGGAADGDGDAGAEGWSGSGRGKQRAN
jgi:cardiolipin synthase